VIFYFQTIQKNQMRKKIIAGNWKMNKTVSESVTLAAEVVKNVSGKKRACDVVLCPTFLAIESVLAITKNSDVKVGGQNLYFENDGAFTGEISATMLKAAGCDAVIIGHSERRQFFGETDGSVNKKTKKALSVGLMPIVCVGETLAEREANQTNAVIDTQVRGAFAGLGEADIQKIVVAYEPVWAIGTGKTATPQQADDVHRFIRDLVGELYSAAVAQSLTILYGGSMKAANAKALLGMPNIDGGLIGGAALKADEFTEIVFAA
jgi:triosephosphate isomerase